MTEQMRDFTVRLAQKAGGALLEAFQRDQGSIALRSTAKEAASRYDKLIDRLIIEEISKALPRHSILTEESGYHKAVDEWLWIIDSLDGTGNFSNHNPFFAVCIALLHRGELTLGVVYAPALNELYLAEKGKGAYLNGVKLGVSNIDELNGSYIIYCEGGCKDQERSVNLLQRVYPQVTDIRKLGSAGLETAWVASGRAEAYFTTDIEPWDVAAGVLLVSEAGGKTSDFNGNPWRRECGDYLFSNGHVHPRLLELLQRPQ
jgi:myo-inositol-1(or 4)-monophosphatase